MSDVSLPAPPHPLPLLLSPLCYTSQAVLQLMDGTLPLIPNIYFPLVDVRDVALAHVLAAEREGAQGRYIVTSDDEPWSMKQMAGGRAHTATAP